MIRKKILCSIVIIDYLNLSLAYIVERMGKIINLFDVYITTFFLTTIPLPYIIYNNARNRK